MGRLTLRAAALAAGLGAAGLAYAQAPGEEPRKDRAPSSATRLHLSAEGSVSAAPDELLADLVAEARSPSPGEAQRKVNVMMSGGMRVAAAVQGVQVKAVGYSVRLVEAAAAPGSGVRPPQQRLDWSAQQTLELRASQGETLLDLAGRLQEQGFAATSLDWRLSPELSRRSRDEAMVEAIKALRARAAAAASALGLQVDRMEDVRVDARQAFPVHAAAAPAAVLMAAPEATRAVQAVTAEVSADILLKP